MLLYKKTVINTVRSFVWRAWLWQGFLVSPLLKPSPRNLCWTTGHTCWRNPQMQRTSTLDESKNRQSYVCPGWCNEMSGFTSTSGPKTSAQRQARGPATFNSCSYTLYTVVFGLNWGSLPLLVSRSFTSPSSLKATILWFCHFSSSMGWLQNCPQPSHPTREGWGTTSSHPVGNSEYANKSIVEPLNPGVQEIWAQQLVGAPISDVSLSKVPFKLLFFG